MIFPTRRILLFGGKGGVGKTTIASMAALEFAKSGPTILFTTDPASNLQDVFGSQEPGASSQLRIEPLDAEGLYRQFLDKNLESFLEAGDRGTYLDREELRRFFELSLPGADELMAWMHIGELAEANPGAKIIVDTAPTGHALRMLAAAEHFRQFGAALDAMQEKHRVLVEQFTRRSVADALDTFIDEFESTAKRRRELLRDASQTAFIPIVLSEPWVVEQTLRLVEEVRAEGIDVPMAILNRAVLEADCDRCRVRQGADEEARKRLAPLEVRDVARSCVPIELTLECGSLLPLQTGQLAAPRVPNRQLAAASLSGSKLPHSGAKLLFFAGKGGVGKTTCAASVALQLARGDQSSKFTIISVDPAHALRDVFASESPPDNLSVEIIDTRAKWRRFRDTLGVEIENAVAALTPKGMTVAYDTEALQKLIEVAPPGADELFAVNRLAALATDPSQSRVLVDTAPTGHFLRLMDLPRTAGEWVREFIRILLRYREVIPAGSLGSELVQASRSLKELQETLQSERSAVFVVTRPERIVIAETRRLIDSLAERRIRTAGVIANYVTPENDCACDRSMRSFELEALQALPVAPVIVERRDRPVTGLDELARLFDIESDSSST
jgi:arsenite-transporting ATPase